MEACRDSTIPRYVRQDELRPESLDVNRVVEETVQLLQSEALLRNVAMEIRLQPGLPPVEADRVHLQQVLVNLIRNGLEAIGQSPAGERRVVVRTARDDGPAVRVSVSDSGDGFSGQDAEDLFAPFHSTKAQGLGMGLAISRSIIESHGGRIWASENPDRGATFHFRLPTVEP